MTTNKEVKFPIDRSFTQPVCDHAVGFLKFKISGNVEFPTPAGTGTFVRLGKVYGILTAGHVLQTMGKNEIVGLCRFPSVEPNLQNFRLNLDHTEREILWNGAEGDAPDIAFLKIPEVDTRALEAAGAVFYNLGLSREFRVQKAEHQMSKGYAVVGIVGEWTQEASAFLSQGKKVDIGGLFGAATNLRAFNENGTDVIEVKVDHAEGPQVPQSYEGMSGSGLWELHTELDEKLKPVRVNKRLHGVAFRQSEDHTHLTSNAASSIEAIKKKITAKWPEANQ